MEIPVPNKEQVDWQIARAKSRTPVALNLPTDEGYVDLVASLLEQPSITLNDSFLKELPFRPETVAFYPPDLDQGAYRGASANKVFFGKMIFRFGAGTAETVRCAVKQKSHGKNELRREFEKTCEVRRRGVSTIEPLGYMTSRDSVFVITRYRDDLRSADRIAWSALPEEDREQSVHHFLRIVAQNLAAQHAQGIFHGDLQTKNVSFSPNGEIYFYDWESAEILDAQAKVDPPALLEKSLRGIKKFMDSCYTSKKIRDTLVGETALAQEFDFAYLLRKRANYGSLKGVLARVNQELKARGEPLIDEDIAAQCRDFNQLRGFLYKTLGEKGLLKKPDRKTVRRSSRYIYGEQFQEHFLLEYYKSLQELVPDVAPHIGAHTQEIMDYLKEAILRKGEQV